jgi:hypothetical protein
MEFPITAPTRSQRVGSEEISPSPPNPYPEGLRFPINFDGYWVGRSQNTRLEHRRKKRHFAFTKSHPQEMSDIGIFCKLQKPTRQSALYPGATGPAPGTGDGAAAGAYSGLTWAPIPAGSGR